MEAKKILIVGGVAGGASAAARARRLSEQSQIIILEKGPYVSFANCGLPYYVGGEIPQKDSLLIQTPQRLWDHLRIEVRLFSEVVSIDKEHKLVTIYDHQNRTTYHEHYDALILATGSEPVKPPIPNIDYDGHFFIHTIPQAEAIDEWIKTRRVQTALVIGAGFIGLEMVEQLLGRGLKVQLVEAMPQLFSPLDPEMTGWILETLEKRNIPVYLNDPVTAFDRPMLGENANASVAVLQSGRRLPADLVILAMGVKPNSTLAQRAGLEIGSLGGIRVNEYLQTSDPYIWAVGDAIEIKDLVTGQWSVFPLAGLAVRQARIAADNIFGRNIKFKGAIGTAIVRIFDCIVGVTGANEKKLKACGIPYIAIHLHPMDHASYYPGASQLHIKVLFHKEDGRLLGAQVVGKHGVDKRIDVFASAIMAGMNAEDLALLELAYAPPFGAAKDPVNLAGMIAQNVINGDVELAQWYEVLKVDRQELYLVDVRSSSEWKGGHIPGAVHIPLAQLRDKLDQLPKDRQIIVACQSGQRSYIASRLLKAYGFRVKNLTGSYLTWKSGIRAYQAIQRVENVTPSIPDEQSSPEVSMK